MTTDRLASADPARGRACALPSAGDETVRRSQHRLRLDRRCHCSLDAPHDQASAALRPCPSGGPRATRAQVRPCATERRARGSGAVRGRQHRARCGCRPRRGLDRRLARPRLPRSGNRQLGRQRCKPGRSRQPSADTADPTFRPRLAVRRGNDILRHRRLDELVRDSEALLRRLHRYGDAIVWMGPPNIGLAPLFVPPLSWWFSRRARRACDAFKGVAGRERAHYVDFYRQARFDTFSAAPKHFFAADDIHPSTNAYRFCYHAAAIRQRVAACLFDRTSPVESCRQSLALQRSAASALPQQ